MSESAPKRSRFFFNMLGLNLLWKTPIYIRYRNDCSNKLRKKVFSGIAGAVFWLYGLSGSGKSTLAIEMEKRLHKQGALSIVLDGDNLRTGLNKDLTFSEDHRKENVRRVSEVAKLLCENGLIVLVSLITPLKEFRESARSIIGSRNFKEIYIKASFETCQQRDVKGLYAKANQGLINTFTGKGSCFEEPEDADLIIESESNPMENSAEELFQFISLSFFKTHEKLQSYASRTARS